MSHLSPRGSILVLVTLIFALAKPKTGIGYDRHHRKYQQLWNSSVKALTA